MTVLFNEICGKTQGKMALIEAETFEEAIEKFGGVDEKISPHSRFSKYYFGGIYEVKEQGKPNPAYIVHSTRKL